MINMMSAVSGVGLYHIGKKISELIFIFTTAFENVFIPNIIYYLIITKKQVSLSVYL